MQNRIIWVGLISTVIGVGGFAIYHFFPDLQRARIDAAHADRMQQIAQIEDPALQQVVTPFAHWVHAAALDDIQRPAIYRGPTYYLEDPWQRIAEYGSVENALNAFVGSHLASLTVGENIDVIEPFAFPLPYTLTWDDVTLDTGEILPVDTDWNTTEQVFVARPGQYGVSIEWWNRGAIGFDVDDIPTPIRVTGHITTTLPTKMLQRRLSEDDVGTSRDLGPYVLALTAFQNSYVQLTIKNADGTPLADTDPVPLITATDGTGGTLQLRDYTEAPPGYVKAVETVIDGLISSASTGGLTPETSEAAVEALFEQNGLSAVDQLDVTAGFTGNIETINLILPVTSDQPHRQDMVLDVHDLTDDSIVADIAISAEVHDILMEPLLANAAVETDPRFIDQVIDVSQDNASLVFSYPQVLSNVFLHHGYRYDIDVGATFVFHDDNGRTVGQTFRDDNFFQNRLDFSNVSFTGTPVRASGSMPITVMPDISRLRFAPMTAPDGIAVIGNQVHVHKETMPNFRNTHALFAYSASGRLLKESAIQNVGIAEDERYSVFHFYGEVAEVEVLKRGKTETVTYTFDIPLYPIAE